MLLTGWTRRFSRHDLLLLLTAFALAWGIRVVILEAFPGAGHSQAAPGPGWSRLDPRVPVQRRALQGPLPPLPNVLNLDHFAGAQKDFAQPIPAPMAVSLDARWPAAGALELTLFQLDRRGKPRGITVMLDAARPERAGISAWSGNQSAVTQTCPGQPLARSKGSARPAWQKVSVRLEPDHVRVELGGIVWGDCGVGLDKVDHLTVRSGLQRIQVDDVTVSARGATVFQDDFSRTSSSLLLLVVLWLGCVGVLLGARWVEVRLQVRSGVEIERARAAFSLTSLPLFSLLFADSDISKFLEALHVDASHPGALIVEVGIGMTVLVKVAAHLARPGIGRPAMVSEEGVANRVGSGSSRPVDPLFFPQARKPAPHQSTPIATPSEAGGSGALGSAAPGRGGTGRRIGLFVAIQALSALVLADGPRGIWYIASGGLALPIFWVVWVRRGSRLPSWLQVRIEAIVAVEMGLFALGKIAWQATTAAGVAGLISGMGGAWMPYAWTALAVQVLVRLWLANLNAALLRGPNLLSLFLVAALGVTAEAAVRSTYLGKSLDDREAVEVFEELEAVTSGTRYRDWPDKLFPVAFPPRQPDTRLRVVCMGGSSTAGAYQMRDLTLFYPFRLQLLLNADADLRPVDVLNQGVGGWNTLHMRLYLERMIDALDPDLLTFYVGHNDILTRASAPYKAYLEQFRARTSLLGLVHRALNRVRLYVLFKQMILAPRSGGVPAVSVDDARDNLEAVASLAESRGVRVLLMSEGLSPAPDPLSDYFTMLHDLAAGRSNVWYFDSAGYLASLPQAEVFLDDCHLTAYGHNLLAKAIYEFLREHPVLLESRSRVP